MIEGDKDKVPNPGSDGALEEGCTCPVLDNCSGKGHLGIGGMFLRSSNCPAHSWDYDDMKNEPETNQ